MLDGHRSRHAINPNMLMHPNVQSRNSAMSHICEVDSSLEDSDGGSIAKLEEISKFMCHRGARRTLTCADMLIRLILEQQFMETCKLHLRTWLTKTNAQLFHNIPSGSNEGLMVPQQLAAGTVPAF